MTHSTIIHPHELRQQLVSLSDEKYRRFSSALLPGTTNLLGVRLPLLRNMARALAKKEWRSFLEYNDFEYCEEVMLQGMTLGYVRTDFEELLHYIALFVPRIDNWSVCDSFCNGLKAVARHRVRCWKFLQPYFQSEREFDVRFGSVMLLCHFLVPDFLPAVLQQLEAIRHEGYYARMGAAWALSVCFVRFPEETMPFLKNNRMDSVIFQMALQKITESLRTDEATKKIIRELKRQRE